MDDVLDGRAPARPPVASFALTEAEAPAPRQTDRLLSSPHWAFHVASVLGALGVIWAASAPASRVSGGDLSADKFAWLALACAAAWAVRLVLAVARGRVDWAYVVTPAIALAAGAAIYVDVPQETRWMQAEGSFESTLRALPTAKKWDQNAADAATPGRIGTYHLDGVSRDATGAAQFHLEGGAAFTYLLDGVTAEVTAANPGSTFEHLHGNWYVLQPAS